MELIFKIKSIYIYTYLDKTLTIFSRFLKKTDVLNNKFGTQQNKYFSNKFGGSIYEL